MSESSFTIATRGSELALWQARFTAERLPGTTHIEVIKTKGDRIQHLSLDKVEGKGFFTKEIEDAILNGAANIAVHSLKDLPTDEHPDLEIVAVPKRYPANDVLLVAPGSFTNDERLFLTPASSVGTSSIRRKAQLKALRPDVELVDIRGNVPTRAHRVTQDLDAVVLAEAGLIRLGLMKSEHYVTHRLSFQEMLPAPAQGALGIQMRRGDPLAAQVRATLHCQVTSECVDIERGLLNHAGGGCHLPMGALVEFRERQFFAHARVTAPDGSKVLEARGQGDEPSKLVTELWRDLAAQGAEHYL